MRAQLVTYLSPQEPMDEIMSVNPSLRRKGHRKRDEEFPDYVVLLDGCPPFLKEQFINYILRVNLKRQIGGLSVPSRQWEAERHLVIHSFCQSPWMGLSVKRHFRFLANGVGHLPGWKDFGYWFPSHGHV